MPRFATWVRMLSLGLVSLGLTVGTAAPLRGNTATSLRPDDEGPQVGDPAPDFELQASDGKTYKLSDFKGKQAVVIAWFPRAFTSGCTAECKSFRESSAGLKSLGVAYFTASVDEQKTNADFAASLDLDYPILCDPTKQTARAYGVLGDRPFAQRWTFYIDKKGIIRAIDKQVNTRAAGEDVIKKVKELGLTD
ncbi:alkyl hydroperoxide reductase/ Thiol specific antioxidant/ Mal allergen [Isosphaera pallida ATCC 43644]|uniref:thioredoxin-dependent peroxiredoxin n=1 Tax=Isosphaera pallida (strain ATCC 43644 / DSM 9630 / IS1B) TaxID=575540 RepID=E8QXS2_ISOPI|nr:peroxiredoxin [Isosphaera pallida]ADV64109.1 alkyl hydroperoxide reductase/ Thiol specific antioxidant/ Mal allergen [Isosphaera pallida ATCC 43644]